MSLLCSRHPPPPCRVLVTEWIHGASPTQLLGKRGTCEERLRVLELVRMGIQCSLSQLLVTGVMHGDPHSGNLLMTRDDRLCYLDFGLVVRCDRPAGGRPPDSGAGRLALPAVGTSSGAPGGRAAKRGWHRAAAATGLGVATLAQPCCASLPPGALVRSQTPFPTDPSCLFPCLPPFLRAVYLPSTARQ